MDNEIDVSFVMTVYNKEKYLPSVLKALLNQSGLENPEFIFVDDLSKDRSVAIIEEMTEGIPNVVIVQNVENKGISKTTNIAIQLARGKFTRLLDSDDILPIDSTEKMIELAKLHEADMVYGCFLKTGKKAEELTNKHLESFTYKYTKDAMNAVLTGRFTRMGQLLRTEPLKKSGGADERVFIQDESLPIRVAMHAKGAIKMTANVVLVPEEDGNFSGDKVQLDHDRFLTYAYAILDYHDDLPCRYLKLMYKRAVSAYWKYVRKSRKVPYLTTGFFVYLMSKLFNLSPSISRINKMKDEFLKIYHVRRNPEAK